MLRSDGIKRQGEFHVSRSKDGRENYEQHSFQCSYIDLKESLTRLLFLLSRIFFFFFIIVLASRRVYGKSKSEGMPAMRQSQDERA